MKENKGFSLVELIIAISILAILTTVISISLVKYLERTNKVADVNSAKAITEEFRMEYYSNPEFYSEVNAIAGANTSTNTEIIAYCDASDTEWTVRSSAPAVSEFMNENCAVRQIRYRKPIDPSYDATPEEEADKEWKYVLGSFNDFTPKGWAIALVDDKPVVFVTDGDTLTQGVSPLVCADYPGPGVVY